MAFDLVLSSGFLAFARHVGVLRAVERSGNEVSGLCGTSSGALVGALWAAGVSADRVLEKIVAQQPFAHRKRLSLIRLGFRQHPKI